jgi:hypothetical protein
MKLISSGQDLVTCAQVDPLFKALQVALPRVRIGIFLMDQSFQCLGQQTRDRGLALDGKLFDLEQDFLGK